MQRAMASGKLPNFCQDDTTGERTPGKPGSWKTRLIYYEKADPPYVRVFKRPKDKHWNWASDPGDEDGGQSHFVSRSHFEQLFFSSQRTRDADAVQPETRSAPPASKPGTKPREDWPTKVGAWLILKACEDPRQLENIDVLVSLAQDHLQEEIGWAPENTGRIRRQILDFLQLIRR
jgi:hypothetical protein